MNVLIIHAHPEPHAFTTALKDRAVMVLESLDHAVQVSDLYAMQFKAVGDQDDVRQRINPDYFKPQAEQNAAYAQGNLAEDILEQQERLRWCNLLILNFPLWWSSMPAIMKGWVDRVFTTGFVYGNGRRYETGGLRGRQAMLTFTTGGSQPSFSPEGEHGDIQMILHPIQHGILRFAGFDVLPPFIAWSPASLTPEARTRILDELSVCLKNLQS